MLGLATQRNLLFFVFALLDVGIAWLVCKVSS